MAAGVATLAAIGVSGPAQGAESPPARSAVSWNKLVRSYPGLRIPRVFVQVRDSGVTPGFMFLTPRAKPGQRTGPTILDAQGRVVWFHRLARTRTAIGLEPQVYDGKPVLTWGQRPPLVDEGDLYTGNKRSVYNVIADDRYRIIKRIRAIGRDVGTDLHEFVITPRNTALVLGWRHVRKNLRRYGGSRKGIVLDSVVQEIDIRSGRLLLNWSATRRLSPRNALVRPPREDFAIWDPYHVNSISLDSDGHLLLTARHTSAVYKVHRKTGEVLWTLGGRGSNFRISSNAHFHYPHDAQRQSDGSLTIFDNRSTGFDKSKGNTSRALRLRVDARRRRVSLAGSYRHPQGTTLSTSQGNARVIQNGNVFVGWGSSPWFSEHAPDGRVLFAAHFQSAWNQSYRAFKEPWQGKPPEPPAVTASTRTGRLIAFVAWNGATDVAAWRVLGGAGKDSLAPLGDTPWADFETKIDLRVKPAFIKVQALDAAGKVLGESAVIAPRA